MLQTKSIPLEVKDIDTGKRTAVICHAVHDNIDRTSDIGRKGMFTKSWQESKSDIALYLNHDDTLAPGSVEDVFEEGNKAFTKAKFGTHTLGNDTLIMLDEKTIKWASYGYIPVKTNPIRIKEKSVRELLEVKHIETSPLTKMPANPLAGIVSVTKSFSGLSVKGLSQTEFDMLKQCAMMDQQCLEMMVQMSGSMDNTSDLFSWILYQISRRADMMSSIRAQLQYNAGEMKAFKQHIETLEKFCRNTKASDECIKSVQADIEEGKQIIASYDTDATRMINEPASSSEGNDSLMKQLLLLQVQIKATA